MAGKWSQLGCDPGEVQLICLMKKLARWNFFHWAEGIFSESRGIDRTCQFQRFQDHTWNVRFHNTVLMRKVWTNQNPNKPYQDKEETLATSHWKFSQQMIITRMVTPEPHPEVLGGSKFLNNFLPIHPAALSFPLTTTDHDSHHDIYLCICLSHFTSMNNFRFCPWARPGYSRRWPGACTNCSLPTSLLAQRLLFLWWDGSVFVVFFPRKVLLKFYLHEVIHFHLFVPSPVAWKMPKTSKYFMLMLNHL